MSREYTCRRATRDLPGELFSAFWSALIPSVLLIGGITGTVFGAVKWEVTLFIASVATTFVCMTAVPLLWIRYGFKRSLKSVFNGIASGKLTVSELCADTGLTEEKVRERISKLILKDYVAGYVLANGKLIPDAASRRNPE